MRRISRLAALFAALLSASAQERPKSQPTPAQTKLLVLIPVVALDHGNSVDFCAQPFSVSENGARQFIDSCGPDTRPLTVAILVDVSGSMRPHIARVRETLYSLLQQIPGNGQYSLFLGGIGLSKVATPPGYQGPLADFLASVQPYGQTAIFDHVQVLAGDLEGAAGTRRVLLTFTDGFDNASDLPVEKAIEALRRAHVTTYCFAMAGDLRTLGGPVRPSPFLKKSAEATGGAHFNVTKAEHIEHAAKSVSTMLKAASLISYYSTNPSLDGSLRRIKIESKQGSGRPKMQLHYPRGYYAPNQ